MPEKIETMKANEAFGAGSQLLQIVENLGEQSGGFDLRINTLNQAGAVVSTGKLWCAEDHFNGLLVTPDGVITNGRMSRKGGGIVCNDVKAPESDYGLNPA